MVVTIESNLTGIRLAVDVVELSKMLGEKYPKSHSWYVYFAGKHYEKYDVNDVLKIKSSEWQYAKELVYGDKFDFGKGGEDE